MKRRELRGRYRALCDTLAEARIEKGLTQAKLATLLGEDQSFVSKYESGERRLDAVEFFLICGALDLDPMAVWEAIKDR